MKFQLDSFVQSRICLNFKIGSYVSSAWRWTGLEKVITQDHNIWLKLLQEMQISFKQEIPTQQLKFGL